MKPNRSSHAFVVLVTLGFFSAACFGESMQEERYVTANQLNVRLSPSPSGKITNRLDRGQRVDVFEVKNGWARISKYYDGFVEGVSGQVARWVASKYLSKSRPSPRPLTIESPLDLVLKSSDDYRKYRSRFLTASKKLISQGRCTMGDFREMGGWTRSTRLRSVYFTYCGGARRSNRIYLDINTGRIFQ